MTNPDSITNPFLAAGNELRARQSCRELADQFGVDAIHTYAEQSEEGE